MFNNMYRAFYSLICLFAIYRQCRLNFTPIPIVLYYSNCFLYTESRVFPSLSFHIIHPLLLLPIQKSAAVLGLLKVISEANSCFPLCECVYSFNILSRLSFQVKDGTDDFVIILSFRTVKPLL